MSIVLENITTTFNSGQVLTAKMLDSIQRFPRQHYYTSVLGDKNGILYGLNFKVSKNGDVLLSPGAVMYQGMVFSLDKEVNLDVFLRELNIESGHKYIKLYLVQQDEVKDNGVIRHTLSLEQKQNYTDGIFLGTYRFGTNKLSLPQHFEDIVNNKDMELQDIPYLHNQSVTFHPLIFELLKRNLLRKSNRDMYDNILLMQLCNEIAVSKDVIKVYLRAKGCKLEENISNDSILEKLNDKKTIEPDKTIPVTKVKPNETKQDKPRGVMSR